MNLGGRVPLVAVVAALLIAAAGRVLAAPEGLPPTQLPPTPAEPQTQIMLTLATVVTVLIAVSVTFFLLGLLCGWTWRRRRGRRYRP